MKLLTEKIVQGSDEIIIRYKEMTSEIQNLINYIEKSHSKLICRKEKEQFTINPQSVLYFESVENETYVYTKEDVYHTYFTLAEAISLFPNEGFFRCSKSMVINIYRIKSLRSEAGYRIDATMENDEHVIISRRYSKELRSILNGGEI